MDEGFLGRLAIAVLEARGKMSQREFAEVLGVSQSTVQQWENGKNVPSLENLEKIARIKGMLVEDFVAYLYGRTRGLTSKDILDRVEVMPSRDFAQMMRVMADRMDTAKNAPPVVRRGNGRKGVEEQGFDGSFRPELNPKGAQPNKERVPLELPEWIGATDDAEVANGEGTDQG